MAGAIKDTLSGLSVRFIYNSAYEEGLSTSVAAGINALPQKATTAMILLGDMPFIGASQINEILAKHNPSQNQLIGVSTHMGRKGNPVLWDRTFFSDLQNLTGDIGGKPLLMQNEAVIYSVEIGDVARSDLDTRESLENAGAKFGPFSQKP